MFENNNITSYPFVFNFTMPAGATRSFDLTIIDDNVAEYYYFDGRIYIDVGMYESNEMVYCDYYRIDIEDNDGMQHTVIIMLITPNHNNCYRFTL